MRSVHPQPIRRPPHLNKPRPPPPKSKSECQKNPESLACLEEKLSALRSAPSGRAYQRVYRTDEHLTPFTQADVSGIAHLEALIKKKRMIC